MSVVDIGCGTLRGGIPIIERLSANNYVGIDIRSEVEAEAHAELMHHKLSRKNPTLIFGRSLSEIHLARQFDVAWAFSVLFHLTDAHLRECFAFVQEHLKPNGVFYGNVNLGTREPDQWREFPEVWRTLAEYKKTAARFGLTVEDMGMLDHLVERAPVGGNQHMLRLTRGPSEAANDRGLQPKG
jgi:SAM-dependent methyltransferase